MGSALIGPASDDFRVPGSPQEDDNGGELHPDEQADDGGETAIDDRVGHFSDVVAKQNIHKPPEKGRDDRSRQDVAQTVFLRAGETIDESERQKRKQHGRKRKEKDPQSVKRMGIA